MTQPPLPASIKDFIPYIAKNPESPIRDLLGPFNVHEARLRQLYAQSADDELIKDPLVNTVPLYAGNEHNLKIRARDIGNDDENNKYILPLKEARKVSGSSAFVESFGAFKKNFNLFSESSLADLDWDNVVVAGSAVVNSLLPISEEHGESTRALRNYYHEELAPSSDVDLFLWGLTEEQAIEKIKKIEKSVKDSILAETTTIRTKHAITIASQYPIRHIQIVLRLYKSVSEILTGFDVDSSCFAYNGSQVYGTPRGVAAFLTQCNTVDLTRRSPSYENRLFKYATRGFEIYCSDLDRDRIDPTIYERAFARVQGLARLLVLERLPKELDRDEYRDQRRLERARPAVNQSWKNKQGRLRENFKDKDPQDVAEWVMEEQDDVANYHTFTIPYGPRYSAKKIEKLVYTKDLLLNAEWNSKGERSVKLHRHPCFVGDAEYIVGDCCMSCPIPETDEEKEIAAEESKRYVSGDLQFLQDDPGRQTIGSFNPLTSEDWTDQAYLGNTESLCHAIVNEDVDFIKEWCVNNREKLDRRDHTGRTPLQLATQIDAVENVRILVDAGARMVSRLTDGLTALHIACINGNTEIINILLERSEANEELEAEKADGIRQKKKEVKDAKKAEEAGSQDDKVEISETTVSEMDSDEELIDSDDGNSDRFSMTQGSFVKVKTNTGNEDAIAEDQGDEPDFYDVNVLAWDAAVSPLHLAIICGHVEVIKLLISKFGADVLLPVKLVSDYDSSPTGAILTLVLAARNMDRSVELTKALLDLGASPSQSDVQQFSALHTVALLGNIAAMKIMMEKDLPKAKAAMNHIIVDHSAWRNSTLTPLKTILGAKDEPSAIELLKAGANPTIPFDDWAKAFLAATTVGHRHVSHDKASVVEKFTEVNQPVIDAASFDMPVAVEVLLDAGVDINQLNSDGLKLVSNSANTYVYEPGKSLLDIVISKVNSALPKVNFVPSPDPPKLLSQHEYLRTYESGTYQYWQVQNQYVLCNEVLRDWQKMKDGHDSAERKDFSNVTKKTIDEAKESRNQYQKIRTRLLAAGAKRFEQLHPEVYPNNGRRNVDTLEIDEPQYGDTVPGTILLVIDYEIPTVHDTDTTRYTQLFEAAWKGDKESIKALTTKPDVNGNVLSMAVQDNMNISPLHIAIWRGDYDIAEMMLEIAHLQYNPSEAKDGKRNYYIRDRDPDDYDCGSSNSDAGSEDFYVSSDLVNQNFTIDDVANLAQQAGSKTSVLEFLSWSGQFWMFASLPGVHSASHLGKLSAFTKTDYLKNWNRSKTSINFFQDHFGHRSTQNGINVLQFAIDTGDANLLKLILKWYNTYEPYLKTKEGSYVQNSWDKPSESSHLFRALRAGHMNLASELVSSLGNGMPIESLAKDSGIQDSETSKYYQGLLLRGKHKQEWANEANKTGYTEQSQDWLKTSLLLQSVVGDSVAAVEWCLSDSPARLLKEWLSKNEDDQIKRLAQANGGFHKFINDWLDSRRNLAIHMAVLSNKWESEQPDERAAAAEILKYLIRVLPESLETKNVTGHTPLALAFWTRRFEPLSILISAGANQATRDYKGANIAHLAVYQTEAWTEERVEILDKSLALIDRKLIKSLFVERCSLGPSGMTPLAVWLWKYRQNSVKDKQDKMMVKCLETLLKYMDLEPLRMLDGGGQMPIHSCVKQNYVVLLEFLCNKYPELVLLENGMGQTALELCSSIYTGEVISRNNAPGTFFTAYTYLPLHSRSFQDPPAHSKALNLLESAQAKVSSKKRVLISALQASEVVKRLAATKKKESKSGFSSYPYRYQDQFKAQDEVQQWLSTKGYWNMYTS